MWVLTSISFHQKLDQKFPLSAQEYKEWISYNKSQNLFIHYMLLKLLSWHLNRWNDVSQGNNFWTCAIPVTPVSAAPVHSSSSVPHVPYLTCMAIVPLDFHKPFLISMLLPCVSFTVLFIHPWAHFPTYAAYTYALADLCGTSHTTPMYHSWAISPCIPLLLPPPPAIATKQPVGFGITTSCWIPNYFLLASFHK